MQITRRMLMGSATCTLAVASTKHSLASERMAVSLKEALAAALADVVAPEGAGAVARILGGSTVAEATRGLAQIELGTGLMPDQVFRIASVTKMFVAALVLRLVEQGRLALDDPAARYIDGISSPEVTVRRLLNHSAGISSKPAIMQQGFSRRDTTIDAMIADIVQRPLDFTPGSEQSYSNPGYILLGGIIEKITGKAWHQAMHEQLLAPLGLARTRFDDAAALIPGRVAGYTLDAGKPVNASFVAMTTIASAGGLVSTVGDLTRWMAALAEGRVIAPENFATMAVPTTVAGNVPADPYGFGLYIWRVRGETMLGHTGQVNGFASALAYVPRTGHALAVLANSDTFDARTFIRRIGAIAMGRPFPRVAAVPVSPTMLQSLPGAYGSDGRVVWTILAEGERLYAQRPGRDRIALQMSRDGSLRFDPDALTFFRPIRDGESVQLEYARDGEVPGQFLKRIDL